MTKRIIKTPIEELIDSVGNMAQGLDADELYDYFVKTQLNYLKGRRKKSVMLIFEGKWIQ